MKSEDIIEKTCNQIKEYTQNLADRIQRSSITITIEGTYDPLEHTYTCVMVNETFRLTFEEYRKVEQYLKSIKEIGENNGKA